MKVRNPVPPSQTPDVPASTPSLAPDGVLSTKIDPSEAGTYPRPPLYRGTGDTSPRHQRVMNIVLTLDEMHRRNSLTVEQAAGSLKHLGFNVPALDELADACAHRQARDG